MGPQCGGCAASPCDEGYEVGDLTEPFNVKKKKAERDVTRCCTPRCGAPYCRSPRIFTRPTTTPPLSGARVCHMERKHEQECWRIERRQGTRDGARMGVKGRFAELLAQEKTRRHKSKQNKKKGALKLRLPARSAPPSTHGSLRRRPSSLLGDGGVA